jgi:hypothetical protein
MPLETVMMVPNIISVTDQREFAELLNPPAVASEARGGGLVLFSELDGEPVLTLGRARGVTVRADLERVLGVGRVPADTGYMYEGIVSFANYQRGMLLLYAIADGLGGRVIVRGLEE